MTNAGFAGSILMPNPEAGGFYLLEHSLLGLMPAARAQ
jgi:hypothetical protein